ncbi:hypothetical protein AMECASPLE_013141 [Ameca splendens]|uniref:Uncharacterized protein n=1 Tax=Ameca splendens TaxID=208324 RepID=A0ABV0XEC9_9TELE
MATTTSRGCFPGSCCQDPSTTIKRYTPACPPSDSPPPLTWMKEQGNPYQQASLTTCRSQSLWIYFFCWNSLQQ